mmetsp:Transcript_26055/g.53578  ORF Transcript_26055/g.53578 Transcript_26055/m.53578 type:complete len:202 (-) Transcript_26055:90-695(-)
MTRRGHEDLVSPEDAEAAATHRSVGAGLPNHRLEDGKLLLALGSGSDRNKARQLHPRLVVVLARGKGCHARSLSGRVEERGRDLPFPEEGFQVGIARGVCLGVGTGLLPGVEGSQAVAGTARAGPVLRHGHHQGKEVALRGWLLLELGHPELGLVVVGRADNGHVEPVFGKGHGRDGLFESLGGCHGVVLIVVVVVVIYNE